MDNDYCIFEFDDFISKEKCDEIIERFENDPEKKKAGIMTFSSDNGLGPVEIVNEKRKNGREVFVNPNNKKWSDLYFFILEMFAKKVSMQVVDRFCKHFEKYDEDLDMIEQIYFDGCKPFPGPNMALNCTNAQ